MRAPCGTPPRPVHWPWQSPARAGLRLFPGRRSCVAGRTARCAMAISRLRAANHSTCCSFMRSHGGLPITASNPPVSFALSQSDHTPGKATCQFRNRSSVTSSRALAKKRGKPGRLRSTVLSAFLLLRRMALPPAQSEPGRRIARRRRNEAPPDHPAREC